MLCRLYVDRWDGRQGCRWDPEGPLPQGHKEAGARAEVPPLTQASESWANCPHEGSLHPVITKHLKKAAAVGEGKGSQEEMKTQAQKS